MSYAIDVVEVQAVPFACIHRRGNRDQIGALAMPALDAVWTAVRATNLQTGHNVFVYRGAGPDEMDIQFGVQVLGEVQLPVSEVMLDMTPAGTAVHTLYVGPYDKLPEAFAALNAWAERENRPLAGTGWEVYGDWNEDVSKLETDVYLLLA